MDLFQTKLTIIDEKWMVAGGYRGRGTIFGSTVILGLS